MLYRVLRGSQTKAPRSLPSSFLLLRSATESPCAFQNFCAIMPAPSRTGIQQPEACNCRLPVKYDRLADQTRRTLTAWFHQEADLAELLLRREVPMRSGRVVAQHEAFLRLKPKNCLPEIRRKGNDSIRGMRGRPPTVPTCTDCHVPISRGLSTIMLAYRHHKR
jgi:hypothetical protein